MRQKRERSAATNQDNGAEGASPPAARSLADQSPPPWWSSAVINAFILWNLFALTIWLLPGSALRSRFVNAVHPYLQFTGLTQSWRMFSPNPADIDLYWEARIRHANGQVRSWNFPRMVDLGYVERYRRERFRKLIELANSDKNRMVWPSLARFAARQNNVDPKNPPVAVELVRHFRTVPPPGGTFPPFQTYSFFTTPITPEDLR